MLVVRRLFPALLAVAAWSAPLGAQEGTGTIRGRVVDALTQAPIPNVRITVEATQLRGFSGEDGNFAISNVPAGTRRVRANRIGFAPSSPQEVTVPAGGTAQVQFAMEQQAVALAEVVATGYTTQRRVAVTGSVATVDADQANVGIVPNVTNLIQGRAPGVFITQNSGEPGAGAQVRIRGGTSISASNEPLYVIDGIPITNTATEEPGFGLGGDAQLARNPLNLLNPSDIESISILKDAAAAIYGTRAANGVVLIETKKGRAGGATMEYEVQMGRSSPYDRLNVVSGDQYRQFVQQQVSLKNACLATGTAESCANVGLAATQLADLGQANTDWERAITRSSTTANHNLTFSGGSNTTQYRASLNYLNQEGVVLSSGMERYQARLAGTHQALGGRLRLGLNFTGSQVKNDYVPFEDAGGFEGTVFINMVNMNPTHPIAATSDACGSPYFEIGCGTQSVRNPVALASQIQDVGTSARLLGNLSADLSLFAGLSARVNVGVDRIDGERSFYVPRLSPAGAQFQGLAQRKNRDNTTTNLQTVLNWRPEPFGDNEVEILGGYEYNDHTLSSFGAEAREFLTDAFGFNSLTAGRTPGNPPYWAYKEYTRLVSFFTKANYNLRDRYFLTAVIRRDGASNFGAGNKWANFPAISAGWRISQEGFFNLGPISELRLRGGWGRQGNPAVPAYASLLLLEARSGDRYVFGEQPVTGVTPTTNPNPNLKWEATDQVNFAIDYGLMADRFTGSIEYYVKNTSDLLLRVAVPQPAVAPERLENIGKTRNRGVEFSLNALVLSSPAMTWTSGLVFAAERNTVRDLGGRGFINMGRVSGQGQSGVTAQRIMPGQPYGVFWGPQFVRVDEQGRQLFACTTSPGCTGGLTTTPSGDDYAIIGDPNPDYTLGLTSQLNRGRWDASFMIRAVQGQDVFNNTALVYSTKSNAKQNKNFLSDALDDPTGLHEPAIYSSRWIEDGSFVRLQNVTVGYALEIPRLLGSGRTARVYLSGDNLLLLTDYSGLDPEVHNDALWSGFVSRGFDYLHYPRPRTFTGGVRVTF